jgi:lipopolysaccharide transport system permease protein
MRKPSLSTELAGVWAFRSFIVAAVSRDFSQRYKRSFLGAMWAILNPLSMILIYTLVFSSLMQGKLFEGGSVSLYSTYLVAGLLPWGLFAETLSRGQMMFLENANMLKKAAFPKLCLPIVSIVSALLNFIIVFAIFLIALFLQGEFRGMVTLAIVPVLAVQIILAFGAMLLLATLNVFFRDITQMTTILLQLTFWLTPIAYGLSVVPVGYHWIFNLNPLLPIFSAYQNIMVRGLLPDWWSLTPTLLLALSVNILAWAVFKARIEEIVDEV